jgi:hypothetical protein
MKVYFIKPIGMEGPIKIGRSISPDKRRETLLTWCPFPLEIVAEIEGPKELERRFHQHFIDLYMRHEWFRVSNELQAVIREINEGTFDIDCLPAPKKLPVAARNNDYLTEAWRYKRSVCSRLRQMPGTNSCTAEDRIISHVGGKDPELWLAHKHCIEPWVTAGCPIEARA